MNTTTEAIPSIPILQRAHAMSVRLGSGMADRKARKLLAQRVEAFSRRVAAGDLGAILDLGIVLGAAGGASARLRAEEVA